MPGLALWEGVGPCHGKPPESDEQRGRHIYPEGRGGSARRNGADKTSDVPPAPLLSSTPLRSPSTYSPLRTSLLVSATS